MNNEFLKFCQFTCCKPDGHSTRPKPSQRILFHSIPVRGFRNIMGSSDSHSRYTFLGTLFNHRTFHIELTKVDSDTHSPLLRIDHHRRQVLHSSSQIPSPSRRSPSEWSSPLSRRSRISRSLEQRNNEIVRSSS